MPNIKGALVHIPRPPEPPPGRGQKAREGAGRAYNSAKEKFREYTQGPRKKARHAGMNMGSGAAHNPRSGDTIGDIPTAHPRMDRSSVRRAVGLTALTGGAFGGEAIGRAHGRRKYPESKEFKSTALNKAFKPNLSVLNRPPRITDLGTKAEKYENRRWPEFPRKTAVGAGLAGVGLGYSGGMERKKSEAAYVKSVKRKKEKLAKDFRIKQEVPKLSRGNLKFADEGARLRDKARYKANIRMVGRKAKHKKENAGIEAAGLGAGTAVGYAAGRGSKKHVLEGIERDAHLYTPESVKQIKHLAPKIAMGAGVATGALYGHSVAMGARSYRARKRTDNEGYKAGDLRRPRVTHKERVNSRGVIVQKSAFGVDHGVEISKAKKKKYKENKRPMSTGRAVTGTLFPGFHGAFAGKGAGGKARSAGSEFVPFKAGQYAGRAIGAAATKGHGKYIGGSVGGLSGAYGGTSFSHKKGYLKRQKVRPRD